jgi:hypothetical protein
MSRVILRVFFIILIVLFQVPANLRDKSGGTFIHALIRSCQTGELALVVLKVLFQQNSAISEIFRMEDDSGFDAAKTFISAFGDINGLDWFFDSAGCDRNSRDKEGLNVSDHITRFQQDAEEMYDSSEDDTDDGEIME